MNPSQGKPQLRLGAPGGDDSQRSPYEIRLINEMASDEVEMFLQSNSIDTAAARELRSETVYVALAVLERGPLRACTNPSGALVARIRDAKRGINAGNGRFGGPPPIPLDPAGSEIDKFLTENGIDQAGIAALKSEPQDIQKAVMAKGALTNNRNASASLVARIRVIKSDPQGLAAIGNGPATPAPTPMLALPALPALPAAPGVPALPAVPAVTTSPGINDGLLEGEALRAIKRLNTGPAPPGHDSCADQGRADGGTTNGRGFANIGSVDGPGGAGGPSGPDETNALKNAGSTMATVEDKRLQEEAMKAIQALNAG
eukprot:TRINITY_DN61253_c0_g1_i1.p1 TRINITY_DN61253_c0_g1~~TRINITY_DN61253_c0_g1_i1.p1  ORF type:complete len:316 (+),score=42.85 TRINITY_DN61253_c0_g1_i1:41-988(+)